MTNTERTTANGLWSIAATETRADLEALRDALIEHLAPEKSAGQTYNAIFNLKTFNGAMGWANLHVRTAGPTPTPDEVNEMTRAAAEHFGASSAILVNLIPLAGA